MSEIDQQIKTLWNQVQEQKKSIQKTEKSTWLTNCSFSYGDLADTRNIQTVSEPFFFIDALGHILSKKHYYDLAAKELGIKHEFTWSGFSLEDWRTDFKTRLEKIGLAKKRKNLATLEARLDAIVSPEVRRQMELEEIAKLLNEG